MSRRELISVLDTLPPEARQQVVELIAALKKQHEVTRRQNRQNGTDPARQPFLGMWRDRDDMKDSRAWVRRMRQREWSDA